MEQHKPDLTKISLREYRSLFDKDQSKDDEDALVAKVFGFASAAEMLDDLNPLEYKKLVAAMFKQMRDPIESDEKN